MRECKKHNEIKGKQLGKEKCEFEQMKKEWIKRRERDINKEKQQKPKQYREGDFTEELKESIAEGIEPTKVMDVRLVVEMFNQIKGEFATLPKRWQSC